MRNNLLRRILAPIAYILFGFLVTSHDYLFHAFAALILSTILLSIVLIRLRFGTRGSLMKFLGFALAVSLIAFVTYPAFSAQAPSRKALETEIRQRAENDVEHDRPSATLEGLSSLFGEDAKQANMRMREVDRIYQDAYKSAKDKEPWWNKLKPQMGWWVAGLLAILIFIRDFLKDCISELFKHIRGFVYARFSGSRWVRKSELRRYRRAIIAKYEQLKVAFRPDRPLEMRRIYVPLKAKTGSQATQADTFRVISEHRRLMIVGAPGAGKSMLMRHLALTFADSGLAGMTESVPVLLELNRLNESQLSIRDHLVETFRLNEFPHAEQFADLSLEQGSLTLLFDGLDEVNSQRRPAVVRQIRDFLDEFDKVPAIITCRTAVYRQEFSETVEATLEIDDFGDDQIYRFLEAWQSEMPPGKSIEQLLQTLRDRPRIMALARNPLLLTIIAYLYCDTEFVLPHSRTEFYDQSTDVLLQQWKQERNRFKLAQKRLVMQRLALLNQDRAATATGDRKSIEFKTVLSEVKKMLPDLNIEEKEAQSLIDEIVERSGLLLSIDGGERYQFAHLTLQEFFAASELRDVPDQLLSRFLKDPTTWRETVKLWCGLETDSTSLIKGVSEHDAVVALECLADAQKVDAALAESIITGLTPKLTETGETGDAIRRGFAAAASDFRPRGKQVFEYVSGLLKAANDPIIRQGAAETLSYTNLPAAAQVLATRLDGNPEVRIALVRMGDLSVNILAQSAAAGSVESVDNLRNIGTPRAATAMVPLLWSQDQAVCLRAAWCLAILLRRENIESALAKVALDKEWHAESFSWVWKPFDDSSASPLTVIAGKIVHLINAAKLESLPTGDDVLDERIVIPLCINSMESGIDTEKFSDISLEKANKFCSFANFGDQARMSDEKSVRKNQVERILLGCLATLQTGQVRLEAELPLTEEALNTVCIDAKLRRLLTVLRMDIRCPLILTLIKGPKPTSADWVNLNHPVKFKFVGSLHFIMSLLIMSGLTLFTGYEIWASHSGWKCIVLTLLFAWYAFFALVILLVLKEDKKYNVLSILFGPIVSTIFLRYLGEKSVFEKMTAIIAINVFFLGWPVLVLWFTSSGLLHYFDWHRLLLFWCVVYGLLMSLMFRGISLHRKALNIFHGVLARRSGLGQSGIRATEIYAGPAKSSLFRFMSGFLSWIR